MVMQIKHLVLLLLKQWLDSNRLSLNVLKTKCLFTETRHKISLVLTELHICRDSHSIERVYLQMPRRVGG